MNQNEKEEFEKLTPQKKIMYILRSENQFGGPQSSKQMNEILNENTPITSERTANKIGTHTISYCSSVDKIDITHTAKNRDGFAMGAIIAAEWIVGKKGIFSIKDVLAQ